MKKSWEEERKNWNLRAPDFRAKELSPHRKKQLDHFWDFVTEKNLLKKGERAIDIGCGTGDYIRRLAAEGIQMTGTDISDAMIAFAKEDTPYEVEWAVGPWIDSLVAEHQWEGAFDLAYSIFSPAMDGEGLKLLDAVSRRSHLIITFKERKNSVYDAVEERLGRVEESRWKSTVSALYDTLDELGREYKVEVEKTRYDEKMTVDEAVAFYSRRLHRHFDCSLEELEERVRGEIAEITGLTEGEAEFTSVIENTIDWIYW